MSYYKVILKTEQTFTDQEIEDLISRLLPFDFEVVSAINLEGTVEALTLNEEKQTEKLDFGMQDENNPTD